MDGDTTFGAWLKSRRRQLDLTQKGLAHQVGCSVGTIRKMEADERKPSRQLAALLAQHLEIPPDQRETFIAFARSEAYISDTPLPVLPTAEDQIPIIPQETKIPKIKHNLPLEATPFVGREAELAALDELFSDQDRRLVTIVGPGGIGKTRLALAFAGQWVNQDGSEFHPYKDGVYFVDLSPLAEVEQMLFRLAEMLNLRIQAGAREKRSPRQQLMDHLRNRHLLLVLDNFERLLSPPKFSETEIETDATNLVAKILETAPGVCILVTSRERLNLQLEQVYPIQGLTFPGLEIVEGAAEYSALKLFIQSAQRVQPDFVLAQNDLTHLTDICRQVDGMPLGLELAAAWVDMLSLVDIANEIQQSLDFLETEWHDVPSRHRSMRATFDYSWRKMDEKEQSIFSQLSIFRGGFTREAAQAVMGATLRQLSRLANKSFIQFDQQRNRYQIHELLRQYGAERLRQDSELESTLLDLHSKYYCQLLVEYTDDLKGAGQQQAEAAIELDINNIRMAWNQAIMSGEVEAIGITNEPLYMYYVRNGRHMHGIKEFEGALAMLRTNQTTEKRGIILGRILYFLGVLYFFPDQHEKMFEYLKESIDIFQRLGARDEKLKPLLTLARLQTSIDESNRLLSECLTLAREVGDKWAIGASLQYMGENDRDSGNYEQAKLRLQEGLKQCRKTDGWRNVLVKIAWLSFIAVDLGHYDEALTLAWECAFIERKFAPKFPMWSTRVLGRALYAIGEYDKAEDQFQQSLTLSREYNLGSWTPLCLFHLGEISFSTGNYASANQRYMQSLAEALELNNFELVARNQNALGRLALVQGDCLRAEDHLLEALQTANPLGRPPLLLLIFANSAELFAKEKNLEQAALLAAFVTNHKASTARVKERADELLTRLEEQLSVDELAEIRQRSRQSDLDSLAAQLVLDLENS